MFHFGLRVDECANLTVNDINFKRMELYVKYKNDWKSKNGKERIIPITKANAEIIRTYLNNHPEMTHPYIIYSEARRSRVITRTIQRWLLPLKDIVNGINPHWMRYSFCSRVI